MAFIRDRFGAPNKRCLLDLRRQPIGRRALCDTDAKKERGRAVPYVESGALRLFYAVSGSGLPLLWHTGGCGDSTMWETTGYVRALPGYRHILFDHRAHGRSNAPPTIAGHRMSCYVDDVLAVLDDAG